MRDRYTQADYDVQALAETFNSDGQVRKVRRMLERPYGSVRWKAETPDPFRGTIPIFGP
jgi:hypothetical protein